MATSTGLSQLGAVLADIGRNYATTRRQDEVAARQRAQQLADLAAAEEREDARYSRRRADQLGDVASARDYERGVRKEEREETFRLQQDSAIAEEARRLAAIQPDKANAQQLATAYGQQLARVRARLDEVTQSATAAPPVIDPASAEVRNLAQQLAGGSRKQADIDAAVPEAVERLEALAMAKYQQQVQSARVALQTLAATERQLTDMLQTVATTFRVVPQGVPPPSPLLSEPQGPLQTATPFDLRGALSQLAGREPGAASDGATEVPPPARGVQLFENPSDNPVIARGNAALQAADQERAAMERQKTLNDLARERERVQQEIRFLTERSQTPVVGSRPVFTDPEMAGAAAAGGLLPSYGADPVDAARRMTTLLQRQSELDRRERELKEVLRGPLPASATPSAVTTGMFSTPAVSFAPTASGQWWQSTQPTQ